ncbi:retropepsin-like aspartic protease [Algoriphagus sp. D3-2-R+10]|uniref:retropepsin-like aspartic protease n=1 Tax=Algoriphagus aurantiacus TaxID=3103948 RepID=UPI002B37A8F4|nr:retropepsin-like aspartic protease [Algoriphagus sp. D3-2-R+10]MEB2775067.1 retropepsin-like aspartic protease [Algoriphagus sp. D3-2-R+10]
MCYITIKSIVLIIALTVFLPKLSRAQVSYSSVKIHNLHPKPIVKATINGKPAYLLLDTGSDIDLLHSKAVKKYNISINRRNIGSKEMLASVNGMERTFDYIYDIDMMIGEKHIYGNFISMDIGSIITSIHNKTGMTISGIIGSETMKNYCFIIDYEKAEILLKSGRD